MFAGHFNVYLFLPMWVSVYLATVGLSPSISCSFPRRSCVLHAQCHTWCCVAHGWGLSCFTNVGVEAEEPKLEGQRSGGGFTAHVMRWADPRRTWTSTLSERITTTQHCKKPAIWSVYWVIALKQAPGMYTIWTKCCPRVLSPPSDSRSCDTLYKK